MGNRAVITTDKNLKEIGVYLHWNGGRDSVEGFLAYCKMKGFRCPEEDNYGWAYLTTILGNFFGDGLSCGVDVCAHLDCNNYDNGTYIINNWMIVGRKYNPEKEQLVYDLREMVEEIDKAQPEKLKLTQEEWGRFEEVKAAMLAHRK